MAIELQTGLPGHGKTLYTLWRVRQWAEKENRPVYYNGIPDLMIPAWTEMVDATKWMECPPNSIIVIDEAQRLFRPRANGAQVPDYVSKLETHRHLGLDLVLITQHPMLIDGNVRRLTDKHRHCIRPFGSKFAVVHQWAGVREQCDKAGARKESVKEQFPYPKEVFTWYKSAEVHTVKRSIPMKFILICCLPLLLIAAGWYMYYWTGKKTHRQETPVVEGVGLEAQAARPAQGGGRQAPMTQAEWLAVQAPRIAGLPYTAPVFDQVTQPVQAPYPAACVQSKSKGCKCYSQQGTVIDTSEELCRQIVEKGFFVAWNTQGSAGAGGADQANRTRSGQPQADAAGAVAMPAHEGVKLISSPPVNVGLSSSRPKL